MGCGLLGTIVGISVFVVTLNSESSLLPSLISGAATGLIVNFLMGIVRFVLSLSIGLLAGIASLFRRG